MDLSSEIIVWKMKMKYPNIRYRIRGSETLALLNPRYWNGISACEECRPYILDSTTLPPISHTNYDCLLILCSGYPSNEYINSGPDILWFDKPQPTLDVFNEILNIYEEFQDWYDELNRLLNTNQSVYDILKASVKIFGNPLVVLDAAYYVTAIAYPNDTRNWPFNVPDDQNQLSAEEIGQNLSEMTELYNKRDIIYIKNGKNSGTPVLAMRIYDGDLCLGSISVPSFNRDFVTSDYQLLPYLASFIKDALMKPQSLEHGTSNNLQLTKMLSNMLNEIFVSEKDLSLLVRQSGYLPGDHYVAMSLWRDNMTLELCQYLKRRLSEFIPGFPIFIHHESIAVILNLTYAKRKNFDYQQQLSDIFSYLNIRVGVSDIFTSLLSLRSYYKEANIAIHYAISHEKNNIFSPFSYWRCTYALDHCCGEFEPEILYTSGFKRLLDYDRTASVSYIETLEVYLEENLNAASTARRLFIHRNSLISRLERLKEILNEDLENPDIQFYLNLCLRLYRKAVIKKNTSSHLSTNKPSN